MRAAMMMLMLERCFSSRRRLHVELLCLNLAGCATESIRDCVIVCCCLR